MKSASTTADSTARIAALREALRREPHERLIARPTPLMPARRFSEAIGREVWVKRDDLTSAALGGNKVRKLEYLAGEAKAKGADTLIAVGAAQSNHVRTVAAVASMLAMQSEIVLGGVQPGKFTGNIALDQLFGATLHFSEETDWRRLLEIAEQIGEELQHEGRNPYVMPAGGSTAVGALGFVDAFLELLEQLTAVQLAPAAVVHATSTGGTQAGLEFARLATASNIDIVGVGVAKTAGDLRAEVTELVQGVARHLDWPVELRERVTVVDGYLGRAYGVPTPGGLQALRLLARTEGIVVDAVYGAKALHAVREGAIPGKGPVVFWHTGGVPSIFSDEVGMSSWVT
jgi:D-cysteine desulfhydrase family pyridoxal phosphate-dependent enzyme